MSANEEDLMELTMKEILVRFKGVLSFNREERKIKETLVQRIVQDASPDQLEFLRAVGRSKREEREQRRDASLARLKRKRAEYIFMRRNAPRVEEVVDTEMVEEEETGESALGGEFSEFLHVPDEETVKTCYRAFFEATSNAAVVQAVCAVCAREVSVAAVTEVDLGLLPNADRLIPRTAHAAHDLIEGKLLEHAGVTKNHGRISIKACQSCLTSLKGKENSPPKFSLANGLWIGDVPWQLHVLTFPEQLLIALLYPRVYVFKLFPKRMGGSRDASTLQRGMRGTVSTYDLDISGITNMAQGKLMPRPPAVLASIISITFIGLEKLPKNWLHSTFRVRRQAVLTVLRWLKANNPKYYGDIEINLERLEALPEDDVPEEVITLVRQSEDIGIVEEEHAGYVPAEGEEAEGSNEIADDPSLASNVDESDGSPDVIPLQISGAIDTDTSKLTANELMKWGLVNLWKDGQEGTYAVRHGSKPVNTFGRPRQQGEADADAGSNQTNFFEKAFPCLFPYGTGGIEGVDQVVDVDFREHIQWALQYHDRRFRKHETFPFVCFSISQRRQALSSARIQMRRRNFEVDARLLSTITVEKLEAARREEDLGQSISDPAVRLLRQHVHATAGRVQGSDQARYQLRSQIWATSIYLNPPSLWITINPCDLHDPIAQVLAGENIDLDRFIATEGPTKEKRAQNIASDPYAAAKFFHFLIRAILKTLFGVDATGFQVKSTAGIFGRVSAYFGTVESQGRGSLHLHMLVWLKGAPTTDEMHDLLKTEEFRLKVQEYIRANLRACMPGLESEKDVKNIPMEQEIAYSRPPNPDADDYDAQLIDSERRLARSKQVHTCAPRRCLIFNKHGRLVCKRRAPFEYAEDDYVDEAGNWRQKRKYRYLNGWIPGILVNARCNNDGKLLTNGNDTKNCSFYFTGYAAKKQNKTHNMSAVLARGYAFHVNHSAYLESVRDHQRLLIFRLVNTINREQELAAPMVISYLMGWGDVYRSHLYVPIYWSSFVSVLLKAFPELKLMPNMIVASESDPSAGSRAQDHLPEAGTESAEDNEMGVAEEQSDLVTLTSDSGGKVYTKSQRVDYQFRGEELATKNIIEFFVDTYEEKIKKTQRNQTSSSLDVTSKENDTADLRRRPGRIPNQRVGYLSSHPKYGVYHRVIRTAGHNTLPNFIGRYFPRRDDPEIYRFYCACMLLLLKPWRNITEDLKSPAESWEDTFEVFAANAPKHVKNILSGIQYFHECSSAAKHARTEEDDLLEDQHRERDHHDQSNADGLGELGEDTSDDQAVEYTEEGLARFIQSQKSWREEFHGIHAVEQAKHVQIFTSDDTAWSLSKDVQNVANATGDDLKKLVDWREHLNADVNAQNQGVDANADVVPAGVELLRELPAELPDQGPEVLPGVTSSCAEASLDAAKPEELMPDQRRAYDIVAWHLDQTLAGHTDIPPLRMIIHGEGGTGKSKVIQTITDYFSDRGARHMLVKSAYTGVAASLIDGKTTHVIGMISRNSKKGLGDDAKAKLQGFWRYFIYLIIDEISMIGKSFFALLSRHISIGKQKPDITNDGLSFGGINMILCGDFHQFPPVAVAPSEALYYPANTISETTEAKIGRTIYEEFTTIVILREQKRCVDSRWLAFLRNLRYGCVQQEDLIMLRRLVISSPACEKVNFDIAPWSGASLVTPRHAVRKLWNDAAIRKHCHQSGNRLFICTADDTIRKRPLTLHERFGVAGRNIADDGKRKRHKDGLPDVIELAIGMKVMVTSNLETDLDITNGARGVIEDIVLHPDEPPLPDIPIVKLEYLPSYVLVKLDRTRATQLEGLAKNVIPIEPKLQTFRISMEDRSGKTITRTVRRRQYPITAAYASTDYRSQGQTLPYVLVDIASPPNGKLSLFNLYVALSRSKGRDTVRLLRDFDDVIFKASHDEQLLAEDDRLETLDTVTKQWWGKMLSNR